MKRTLIQSIFVLAGTVAVGTCFTGQAEAANLRSDLLSGNVIGFADGNVNNDVEAGYEFGVTSSRNISQILWSGTESTDSFLVNLFRREDSAPLATLTGNISSFVESVQLYNDPTVVDLSFYTLSLDSPFNLDSGDYVLSVQNSSDWNWTRIDGGTTLFRFDGDSWEDGLMSSGGLDLSFSSSTAPHPAQPIPTPALLPGLIGLGMTTLRKQRRKETTAEA
ncbi:PTPA-CTERM sorting domain-containing protein [cf. Phormidesmis sp. LEGE 11477]|uniref:PTPA-CTERM sorting domain-containing protein n=1 Tax=cf. Phormidesmis sp. LEGE 11477 TaxID=1828680 RepID=UPI00187EF421|nr:PTPA-CTERM sorting domain-containing protein [cf. Phormidesmis sp. LEGE 11477]MBE9063719.1 PTPA-CTERM sorting domain-containing protein [cf. Phormidesmis sp. LEGE 11477]